MEKQDYIAEIQRIQVPDEADIPGQLIFMQQWLAQMGTYKSFLDSESDLLAQFLLMLPDPPVFLSVEKELADMLMESRIHHNASIQESYMATADYCIRLAKCRVKVGKDSIYDDKTHRRIRITPFERTVLIEDRLENEQAAQQRILSSGKHVRVIADSEEAYKRRGHFNFWASFATFPRSTYYR